MDILCPFGRPGDLLWVRETLYQNGELGLEYVADKECIDESIIPDDHKPYRNYAFCNIPSIHMPKWAARLWLQVTDVKVELLQDITEDDAISEGVEKMGEFVFPYKHYASGAASCIDAKTSFRTLWQAINGDESWVLNPWVWVISFKVLSITGKPNALTPKTGETIPDLQYRGPSSHCKACEDEAAEIKGPPAKHTCSKRRVK